MLSFAEVYRTAAVKCLWGEALCSHICVVTAASTEAPLGWGKSAAGGDGVGNAASARLISPELDINSGFAILQKNPLFFPYFSSLFHCLCVYIFYCTSSRGRHQNWGIFGNAVAMQSLVAPAVTGPKEEI